ncbi:polysaccharide deacetylase family protein [Streptomyces fuscigenes]|uniref:polysaccharide deacetylase family protein n=1 Tax=Streptomyces fuscigenes TaxID=1528880 RepID=UPI001F21AEA4|nr:polysaccharide deacetylase family protein [Streptomyces fuscigenes]MCF3964033.1 polysaccharide deacetylase family protein [Streptomyces fuscigenes]
MSVERPPEGPLWAAMYHSVADPAHDPYHVTVSPDRLERQLRLLRRRGLTGVSMERLLRARAEGRDAGLVGLTFDDGYADFATHAVPALLRHGFTATVYVLPGRLGGTNEWDPLGPRKPLLTEDGVRAAADAGMEIGSHGLLHVDLTDADAVDDERLAAETAGSRQLLRAVTGREVTGFCYPYGNVDVRAVDAVRAAGYQYAVAIDPGQLTGLHALPRVHVGQEDTSTRLLLKLALHRVRREPVPYGPYPARPASGEPARVPAPGAVTAPSREGSAQ